MSLTALTHVWKRSEQRHSTLLLLLAMADFADDYGRCWASVNTLARKARISERRVVDLTALLEGSGEITIEKGAGPNGTNVYLIVGGAEIAPANAGGGVQFRSAELHPNRNEPSSSPADGKRMMSTLGSGAISGFASVVRAWEMTTGPITRGLADDLGDLADEADRHRIALPMGAAGADMDGNSWICAAIQEARASSDGRKPNVHLIQKILDRWRAEGFRAPRFPGKVLSGGNARQGYDPAADMAAFKNRRGLK